MSTTVVDEDRPGLELLADSVAWLDRNLDRWPVFLVAALVGLVVGGGLGGVLFLALVVAWFVALPRTGFGLLLKARCDTARRLFPVVVAVRQSLADAGVGDCSVSVSEHGWGLELEVETPRGLADSAVTSRCEVLASDLGAWKVSPLLNDRHGVVRLLVQMDDPLTLGATVDWEPMTSGRWDLAKPVPVGLGEDGEPVSVSLWAQTALVGGSPGSGKSVMGWLPLLGAALDPTTILVVVDLKPHGIETAPIEARADYAVFDTASALAIFQRVWLLIDQRNAALKAERLEKVPTDQRTVFPPVVIVVDEAAELKHDDDGKEALTLLQRIVAVGRASGVGVMLLTQKPDGDTIPTNLRDLFAQRVCFRVGNRAQAETVLGVLPEGVAPWEIRTKDPGVGYLRGLDGGCGRFRSLFLDRESITSLGYVAARERSTWKHQHPDAVTELPPLPPRAVRGDDDGDDGDGPPRKPRRRR